jgi:hypothetical protein
VRVGIGLPAAVPGLSRAPGGSGSRERGVGGGGTTRQPRIVTGRYSSLADDADMIADDESGGRARDRTGRGRWVDVATNARKAGHHQQSQASRQAVPASGGRSVDAASPCRRPTRQRKQLISTDFVKPSDRLEPSTPSLPCAPIGNRSQPVATVLACWSRFRGSCICHRLPLVATARLHKRSIPVAGIPDEKGIRGPRSHRPEG